MTETLFDAKLEQLERILNNTTDEGEKNWARIHFLVPIIKAVLATEITEHDLSPKVKELYNLIMLDPDDRLSIDQESYLESIR